MSSIATVALLCLGVLLFFYLFVWGLFSIVSLSKEQVIYPKQQLLAVGILAVGFFGSVFVAHSLAATL